MRVVMRSMVCVPPQCMRDALRRMVFVFAFCVAPFTQAGNAASADVSPKAVESAVRHAPAPSVRQMLETATNTNDASQSNLRRLLDSATGTRAPRVLAALQPAATVSLIANTSSTDEIFAGGFDRPCRALGNSCGSASDCCSTTCNANTCINASGTIGCRADSDLCSAASDCCSGQCDLTGASGGSCVPLSDFGVGSCTVDGEPCSSSSSCCSQLCASVPGGGMACQSPSGCQGRGELCTLDAACCGGTGGGTVHCSIIAGTNPAEGLCSNPVGCKPDGEVCGGTAGNDCCGSPGNSGVCTPDLAGVNRCSTGAACSPAGQVCASSTDCCNAAPCVPDVGGILRCAASACVPSAAACTTNADCCSGLQCSIAPGALGGTCVN